MSYVRKYNIRLVLVSTSAIREGSHPHAETATPSSGVAVFLFQEVNRGNALVGPPVAELLCVVQACVVQACRGQAVKELPHPHPPVAFGFRNVKPDPIMLVV